MRPLCSDQISLTPGEASQWHFGNEGVCRVVSDTPQSYLGRHYVLLLIESMFFEKFQPFNEVWDAVTSRACLRGTSTTEENAFQCRVLWT